MAVVVVVLLVVAVVVVRSVVLRDRARPLTTDEAVGRFREASVQASVPVASGAGADAGADAGVAPTDGPSTTVRTSSAGTGTPAGTAVLEGSSPVEEPPLVEPGVYRYRTTGSEEIDALDGARHQYPEETTITVVETGCGVSLRWDALVERWDEWALCVEDEGIVLQPHATQFHQFFGQAEREEVACDVGVLLVAVDVPATGIVEQTCTLGDDPWLPTWRTLPAKTRAVDGEQVEVRHVRMVVEDDDEFWERQTVDWYIADSGLPVEVVVNKSSRSPSPIGGVVYQEVAHLELVSFTPMR